MSEKQKTELNAEQYYAYKNMSFIVKPVFREKGKTLCELLLHLIKRDVKHN